MLPENCFPQNSNWFKILLTFLICGIIVTMWYYYYHSLKENSQEEIEGRENKMFGEFIKERRIDKGISLREFCKRVEIDANNTQYGLPL